MQQIRSLSIFLTMACLFVFQHGAFAQRANRSRGGDVYVKPYYRKDGTFVDGHMRSSPDRDFFNNWSTKGNVNPYTGKEGSKYYPDGTPAAPDSQGKYVSKSTDSKPKHSWNSRPISERLSMIRIGSFNPVGPMAPSVNNAIDFGFGTGFLERNAASLVSLDCDFVKLNVGGFESTLASAMVTYRWFERSYRAHGPYVGVSGGLAYTWFGADRFHMAGKLRAGLMFDDGFFLEGSIAKSGSNLFQGHALSVGYRF